MTILLRLCIAVKGKQTNAVVKCFLIIIFTPFEYGILFQSALLMRHLFQTILFYIHTDQPLYFLYSAPSLIGW